MKLSEFDYILPKELIAQHPVEEREKCRLLVHDRKNSSFSDKIFSDIVGYLNEGDTLVLNNTKVIPARLFGKRATGGKVELFILEKKWPISEALVRPSVRIRDGEEITLESGDSVEVLGRGEVGRFVKFERPIEDILRDAGHMPLPPYISRSDEPSDKSTYQTVYSSKEGATASPTAGLHFTEALLEAIKRKGVNIAYVTLHTSYGTFAPVKADDISEHKMHKEYFELPSAAIETVLKTKKSGGKVIAVGTTSARVLEYCSLQITGPGYCAGKDISGYTDLFIFPGYEFKIVDHLITNFHLPKTTLLLLVSALAGQEGLFKAYRHAIESRYRFFSYGDAMLIL